MIKIEKTMSYGWEAALRGMRNPMNSWDKADSVFYVRCDDCEGDGCPLSEPSIGDNDHELMMKLAKSGTDHAKYRRMITVTCDITAPLYWWKEFDTYKVGTVANSCSTMHKIHSKDFTLDDFSHEHMLDEWKALLEHSIVSLLNMAREAYIATKDKTYWWQMIQLLPTSYNQMRTIQLNYEVLRNMYHSRKNHKLDEWRTFCEWIESLPYSEIITDTRS